MKTAVRGSCAEEHPGGEWEGDLLAELGGTAVLETVVVSLYTRILDDSLLRPFFEGMGFEAQVRKQLYFLRLLTGHGASRQGIDLARIHERLVSRGLGSKHFDRFMEHCSESLFTSGVQEDIAQRILVLLRSLKAEVLRGRAASDVAPMLIELR